MLKNPFSEEGFSGVILLMVGVVVLVFAGLFTTLISDFGNRYRGSNDATKAEQGY